MAQEFYSYNQRGKGVGEDESEDNQKADSLVGGSQSSGSVIYIPDYGFESATGSTISSNPFDEVQESEFFHRRTASRSSDSHLRAQLQQDRYNHFRSMLSSSINSTSRILVELQQQNKSRPLFYPASSVEEESKLNTENSNIALRRSNKSGKEKDEGSPGPASALMSSAEKSTFNVLHLSLKMDSSHHGTGNLVSVLESSAVASLLDSKITHALRHLQQLAERVNNTSSKVLVTGDLNSGKSTFCNALLRRKLLPEDQQPCTNVFCEVIDSIKNEGIEEVHAVEIGVEYNRNNMTTYKRFDLKDLESLVFESDKYSILKVYVRDIRDPKHSLLNNGVIDITLIDAPGLNMDSYQTTQLFSRQEEIDLVVFVVSAENQFTLSSKEFITAAANEKDFIFIVVNRFDNIKDKGRCMRRVLNQVEKLSPDTHKDARNFVHFVSSSEVVEDAVDGEGGGSGPDDDPDEGPSGSGHPDFDRLEESLRKFVLEKRAFSKLAPVKTYLTNLLGDLDLLSRVNIDVCENEAEIAASEVRSLDPKYNEAKRRSNLASKELSDTISTATGDIYDYSRRKVSQVISTLGDVPLVPYTSVFSALEYAEATYDDMIYKVVKSVKDAESYAEKKTINTIDEMEVLARNLNSESKIATKHLNPGVLFSRRKDTTARQLDISLRFSDFFDPNLESFLTFPYGVMRRLITGTEPRLPLHSKELVPRSIAGLPVSVVKSCGLTLMSVVGSQWAFKDVLLRHGMTLTSFLSPRVIKKLVLPVTIIASSLTFAYLIIDIPRAVPINLAKKISRQLESLDYIHSNSHRISQQCDRVMNYAAGEMRAEIDKSVEQMAARKAELLRNFEDAQLGATYFRHLQDECREVKKNIDDVDLSTFINSVD